MSPETDLFHAQAAELAWKLQSAGGIHLTLSRGLNSPDIPTRMKFMASFGVLWRLSGKRLTSAVSDPQTLTLTNLVTGVKAGATVNHDVVGDLILTIFDSLQHPDASLRQAGETWIRCNVKDPLK